ncbi:helix-turn-helix domain-containing protein [Pseudomonas sp. LRF_L74]|uniref:helix-turn-helix domain-containing protein n=1 Tax=Pseudomonas sp. LRF_L74 TaxID=3369422 RepID=UPI003F5DD4A9
MNFLPLQDPAQLGQLVRTLRRSQGIRQDDLASMVGVSHVFLRDVESGKGTVQLGKVLALLQELGVRLHAEVPE